MEKTELKDQQLIEFNQGIVGRIQNIQPLEDVPDESSFDIFVFENQLIHENLRTDSKAFDQYRVISNEEARMLLNVALDANESSGQTAVDELINKQMKILLAISHLKED